MVGFQKDFPIEGCRHDWGLDLLCCEGHPLCTSLDDGDDGEAERCGQNMAKHITSSCLCKHFSKTRTQDCLYIYKLYNMTMSMIYYDPQQLKVIYHGFSVPFFKESSWKWWPSFYVFIGALNGFYMNHAPASNHSLLYPILVPLQSKQQPTLQELIVLCVFKTFCFLSLSIFFILFALHLILSNSYSI